MINNCFLHAQLGLAAYAPLYYGISGNAYRDSLIAAGMSTIEAKIFSERWRIASQFNDPLSGLSATVFEDVVDGKRYLSIRGTELTDIGDIGTDLLIVLTGYEINLSAQYRQLKSKAVSYTHLTLPTTPYV